MNINEKKKVSNNWREAFPQLTQYSQNKFYKVVGPVVIGLELIKLPTSEAYRPHFVIYTLMGNKMGNDIKACLAGPIMLKEFYNKKGVQFSIPYENHDAFKEAVFESVNMQTPLSFEGDIPLEKLLTAIAEYSRTPPLSAAPDSFLQAALIETKLKIALYVGESDAQKVLEQIRSKSWDANNFKAFGVELSEWLKTLEYIISDRSNLLRQVNTIKQDNKISKLQSSNLI